MIEISKYTCVLTCRYVRVWLMHGLLTATSVIRVQEISKENNFAILDVPAVPPPQYTDGLWGSRRMKPGSSILYLTQNYSSWKLDFKAFWKSITGFKTWMFFSNLYFPKWSSTLGFMISEWFYPSFPWDRGGIPIPGAQCCQAAPTPDPSPQEAGVGCTQIPALLVGREYRKLQLQLWFHIKYSSF